jgi:flagellar motor switch protein FliN/FliY
MTTDKQKPLDTPTFKEGASAKTDPQRGEDLVQAVYDVPIQVSAVLGRITMSVANLLKLGRGAVIQLDKRVGETIDIFVNDRLVAKGEVVVIDGHLGITITEILRTDHL